MATLKDVRTQLIQIGLPAPSKQCLAAIPQSIKDHFLKALEDHQNPRNYSFLSCVLTLANEHNWNTLSANFSGLSILSLMNGALNYPLRIKSALELILDETGDQAKKKAASQWIISTFCETPKPTPADNTEKKQPFLNFKAYGSSFAFCFNASTKDDKPGIMIDAATSSGRTNDWANATHMWLDVAEIKLVYAVVRGFLKKATIKGHGKANEKALCIENQGEITFISLTNRLDRKYPARGVPLPKEKTASASIFLLQVLMVAYPGIPAIEIIETIKNAMSQNA